MVILIKGAPTVDASILTVGRGLEDIWGIGQPIVSLLIGVQDKVPLLQLTVLVFVISNRKLLLVIRGIVVVIARTKFEPSVSTSPSHWGWDEGVAIGVGSFVKSLIGALGIQPVWTHSSDSLATLATKESLLRRVI